MKICAMKIDVARVPDPDEPVAVSEAQPGHPPAFRYADRRLGRTGCRAVAVVTIDDDLQVGHDAGLTQSDDERTTDVIGPPQHPCFGEGWRPIWSRLQESDRGPPSIRFRGAWAQREPRRLPAWLRPTTMIAAAKTSAAG